MEQQMRDLSASDSSDSSASPPEATWQPAIGTGTNDTSLHLRYASGSTS